jgi:hypothetical protein
VCVLCVCCVCVVCVLCVCCVCVVCVLCVCCVCVVCVLCVDAMLLMSFVLVSLGASGCTQEKSMNGKGKEEKEMKEEFLVCGDFPNTNTVYTNTNFAQSNEKNKERSHLSRM